MSNDQHATWPNVALLGGCLYGLGAPVGLPQGVEAFDMSGAAREVGSRQARLMEPCIATSMAGRQWLRGSGKDGHRPAIVAGEVVLLPTAALPSRSSCSS